MLLFAALLLATCRPVTSSNCIGNIVEEAYDALKALYYSTAGWDWSWDLQLPATTIWNFQPVNLTSPCANAWQGLTCVDELHSNNCIITSLHLNERNLKGYLPIELGNLINLNYLSLSTNSLAGTIPSSVYNLVNLEYLSLSTNYLNGTIASDLLGNLIHIVYLYLDYNSFDGTIPTEIGYLINLEYLGLNDNYFNGIIPSELGDIITLQYLYLYSNSLIGSIPTELSNRITLVVLYLDDNYLTGTIPTELGNFNDLQILSLCSNSFEGTIPTQLGNLVSLEALYAYQNSLVGTIPSELGNILSLEAFYVYGNKLIGTLPSELGKLANLEYMYIADNSFSGSIPTELGNLITLGSFYLSSNLLNGTIPTEFGNLINLEALYLDHNCFSGIIPTELGNLISLGALNLWSNSLKGTIPSELGRLINLDYLGLNDNSLIGGIPSELGNLLNLEAFYASNNHLVGTIPTELGNLTKMVALDISNNMLVGTLPTFLAMWPLLQSSNVSFNRLYGNIEGIFSAHLRVIDWSNNYLTGTLPQLLFAISTLQTVVLGQNCFHGSLPSSICLNHNLEYVVLDLLTGSCGSSDNSIFRGFVLKSYMMGTIPSCIWNSTSLKVLHLLGNGLEGSLSDLSPDSAMTVLALGSNQLTGPIPSSFLQHTFSQLDLSVNRFSGTLGSELEVSTNTTLLDLSVNRLSGIIPEVLFQSYSAGVMNVLIGNLFECQVGDAPPSDVDHKSYVCGSSNFENSLLQWIVTTCFVSLLFTLISKSVHGTILPSCSAVVFTTKDLANVLIGPCYCVAACLICLIGFVVLKLVDDSTAFSSTHAVQYWWTSTIVFLHNWIVAFLVFMTLVMVCIVFSTSMISLAKDKESSSACSNPRDMDGNESSNKNNNNKDESVVTRQLYIAAAHLLNLVIISITNGLYVLVVVDSLSDFDLLVIQTLLGLFKLAWSSMAVPWLLSWARINGLYRLSHMLFMILFVFLGAPFASSFCESSSCFLFVLTKSPIISYSFSIITAGFDVICEEQCYFLIIPIASTAYGSFESPWVYSYQCSSALITGYAPVLLISYLVSGIVIPAIVTLVWVLYPRCNNSFLRKLLPETTIPMLKCLCEGEISANTFSHHEDIKAMGRRLTVKYILNFGTMMTFGLAVPLLAVAVLCDTVMNFASVIVLSKLISHRVTESAIVENMRSSFWDGFKLNANEVARTIYVVMVFVSLFWMLFAFDWIADVYGSVAGGSTMLVPLIAPSLIGFLMLRRAEVRALSTPRGREEDNGMELIVSPIVP